MEVSLEKRDHESEVITLLQLALLITYPLKYLLRYGPMDVLLTHRQLVYKIDDILRREVLPKVVDAKDHVLVALG